MLSRNFYVVLGVPANESSGGIRRAYRELALRYHPDRAGTQGTQYFQELTEAYDVLSDPVRRASYDEGLLHGGEVELPSRPPVRPSSHAEPEPLVPGWLSLMPMLPMSAVGLAFMPSTSAYSGSGDISGSSP